MAIKIPVKYLSYFFAKRKTGALNRLAEAIEKSDETTVSQLLQKAGAEMDVSLSRKEFEGAAETQHSDVERSLQEIIQNSMDAYLERRNEGAETDGKIGVKIRRLEGEKHDVSFEDRAGGLSLPDAIGYMLTVGASSKTKGAVGGHGQGMKSLLGVSEEVDIHTRQNIIKLSKENGEYVAEFEGAEPFGGTRVIARGLSKYIRPESAILDLCGEVDPKKYPITIDQFGKRRTVNSRDHLTFLGSIGNAKIYGTPRGYGRIAFNRNGLRQGRRYADKPHLLGNAGLVVELPESKLGMRGRNDANQNVWAPISRKLRSYKQQYLRLLAKKETLSAAELELLRSGQSFLRTATKTAATAAVAYGTYRAGGPAVNSAMSNLPITGTMAGLGFIAGIPLAYSLANKAKGGNKTWQESGVFSKILDYARAFSIFKPAVGHRPVIPAKILQGGMVNDTRISPIEGRRLAAKDALNFVASLGRENLSAGTNVSEEYRQLLKKREGFFSRLGSGTQTIAGIPLAAAGAGMKLGKNLATMAQMSLSVPADDFSYWLRKKIGRPNASTRLRDVGAHIAETITNANGLQNMGIKVGYAPFSLAATVIPRGLPASWVVLNRAAPQVKAIRERIGNGEFSASDLNALIHLVGHEYAHHVNGLQRSDNRDHTPEFYLAKETLLQNAHSAMDRKFEDKAFTLARGKRQFAARK